MGVAGSTFRAAPLPTTIHGYCAAIHSRRPNVWGQGPKAENHASVLLSETERLLMYRRIRDADNIRSYTRIYYNKPEYTAINHHILYTTMALPFMGATCDGCRG